MAPLPSDSTTPSRSTGVRGWLWYTAFVALVLWLSLLLLLRY
jgi:hypothetical protein